MSFKATALAIILSLSLAAGSALAAASIQPTAPALGADFSIDFGLSAETVERGKKLQEEMIVLGYDADRLDDWCLSRNQIRNKLVQARFDEIDFVNGLTQFRVRVEALHEADGWIYSMIINKCTGEITMLAPLYAAVDVD
jgi:hypothetical protein